VFLAPQKQADGSLGWALPLDPDVRCIHMGDITELGNIVAGAFAHPDQVGSGEYLPLAGDFMSFNEVVDALKSTGAQFSVKQVPKEVFATFFAGAAEAAETFRYFPSSYLLGFGFARQNCARKQNSRPATDQVLDVGPKPISRLKANTNENTYQSSGSLSTGRASSSGPASP